MTNSTSIAGWVSSSTDRGSFDVIWSCVATIGLCVWVSTYPNVPAREDKWYHELIDKFHMAVIGLLGPDILFSIAGGQLMHARRCVKLFAESPEMRNGREWTLTHAFFANMGGFVLTSPDYPNGFPIDGKQLHYLIKHGHVEYPEISKEEIERQSKSDGMAKFITLCQVIFFLFNEFWRLGQGFAISTLELTTITFAFMMFGTSAWWYKKPLISNSIIIRTRDDRTVQRIRDDAKASTHPGLRDVWLRTPLDFISRETFQVYRHWVYYSDFTHKAFMPIISRSMKASPWDRIPNNIMHPNGWDRFDIVFVIPSMILQTAFCLSFLSAWSFHFPSRIERLLWRICASYHAVFSLSITIYFFYISYRDRNLPHTSWQTSGDEDELPQGLPNAPNPGLSRERAPDDISLSSIEEGTGEPCSLNMKPLKRKYIFKAWAESFRNISPDQDPDMAIPLRWTATYFLPTVLYCLCRLYFYIEDVINFRQQPASVYRSVERIFPSI